MANTYSIPKTMIKRCKFLCLLDTMWGDGGEALRWFPINSKNRSGAMLYRLTGCIYPEVWATNCCREQTTHATKHGKPDVEWVRENFKLVEHHSRFGTQFCPLLVMGNIAQTTFNRVPDEDPFIGTLDHFGGVIFLPHPAARNWTLEKIKETQKMLEKYKNGNG